MSIEPSARQPSPVSPRIPGNLRVLHVVNGEYYAGAERVQEHLARRLPLFGYQVAFACLKHGPLHERLAAQGHDVCDFLMRSRFDVTAARRIARWALANGCVLIHTHTPRSALIGALAARLTGLPLVHHVHSPTSRNTANWRADRLNTLVEKAAVRDAGALLPVSASLAEFLFTEGYRDGVVTVVPNGVEISRNEANRTRGGILTIGIVALFRPRKGIEVLLQALARLASQGCPVRLLAVGDFETVEYRSTVLAAADALGIASLIEWRGFRDDVRAELERMDLLALPSLYGEGMPMVVLEALAVGVPVVGSRIEGLDEVVREGREGLLVPPGDAEALADAIALLESQRETLAAMGAEGRRRQRLEFSDVTMARRVSEVYDRVVALRDRREERVAEG